jgi:hypothetical protein
MPTDETQAASFIDEHPLYDGRGTIVCIFGLYCRRPSLFSPSSPDFVYANVK